MNKILCAALCVSCASCAQLPLFEGTFGAPSERISNDMPAVRPVMRPENLDAGTAPKLQPKGRLGTTVVSLGNPVLQGMWVRTPLVRSQQAGTASYNGRTAVVQLIPIAGERTAGSRMSLTAMQALGVPLGDLAEVELSAK